MKIIDNKKDYYDYVVGEYGIDNLMIFDRRKSVVINTDNMPQNYTDFLFSNIKSEKDIFKRLEYHSQDKKIGNYYHYVLKAGNVLYYFKVERFLIDNDNVQVDTFFVKKEENKEGIFNDLILAIIPFIVGYYRHTSLFDKDFEDFSITENNVEEDEIINLPILKNTPVPRFIPAKEIFLNIYSFISSKKDIKIEDKRTDIQKLQSAGFDKIESFRNIK